MAIVLANAAEAVSETHVELILTFGLSVCRHVVVGLVTISFEKSLFILCTTQIHGTFKKLYLFKKLILIHFYSISVLNQYSYIYIIYITSICNYAYNIYVEF